MMLLAHGPLFLCPLEIAPIFTGLSLWWLLWPRKTKKRK